MAELADAQDLKSCGKRFPCRFDPGLGHHVGASYACSDFLLHKKSVTRFTATPLSQKVTLSVGYLLASALITPLVHYQPFASKRLWRGILKLFGFFKGGLHYAVCFSIKKTPKAEVFFLGLI